MLWFVSHSFPAMPFPAISPLFPETQFFVPALMPTLYFLPLSPSSSL